MTDTPSPWWSPEVHADRRHFLRARACIKETLRLYFIEHGFAEVECGQIQVSPGNEAHLSAFATEGIGTDGRRTNLYLHTSPEFACKKLLAAGETKIFDFARVFRNRERGPLHAPEFTMLEWYRANETYEAVIEDALRMVALAADAAETEVLSYREREADPRAQAERVTVAGAFRRLADIDLLATIADDGETRRDALAQAATQAGAAVSNDDTWSDIYSKVLVERIEPHLGIEHPTILYEYPRAEAALARACPHDPRVAERFELYVCGVELANGFGELTDAVEQRKRFESEMDEKQRIYGERYPLDEDFLAALAHLPAASGVALGFDRLVMLATGARHIDQVQWTPFPAN
jgi:elongation factor P--(R)-beta-lysine ligase